MGRKTLPMEEKIRIGRAYANHIINTGDSQTHTAYVFCVTQNTVHNYIKYLKDSPNKSDVELYESVSAMCKSRSWGYNFYKA